MGGDCAGVDASSRAAAAKLPKRPASLTARPSVEREAFGRGGATGHEFTSVFLTLIFQKLICGQAE